MVVHTGDLTASGSQAEFSVGATFLRHGHYLENGSLAGLGLDTEFGQYPFDLPGNHDLWRRGSPKDHAAFTSHYGGKYPKRFDIATPAGKVVLHGLDSNRGSTWSHRLANGEVGDESLRLACEAMQAEPGTIHVVCLHHPLALRTRARPRLFGVEILRLHRREHLAATLANAGARLALSGHVHVQQRLRATPRLIQFVAGSACQIGTRPQFWVLNLHRHFVEFECMRIPEGGFHFDRMRSRYGSVCYHATEE